MQTPVNIQDKEVVTTPPILSFTGLQTPGTTSSQLTDLQQELMEKDILLSLNNDIASTRDKNDLLQLIHNRLKTIFRTTDIFICLLNTGNQTISPYLVTVDDRRRSHPGYEKMIGTRFPVRDGVFDRILASAGAVVLDIGAISQSPDPPAYVPLLWECGLAECLSAPLTNGNKVMGALTLFSETRSTFNSRHLKLMENIAAQISIAIANIIANEEIQRRDRERTILLDLSRDMASVRNRTDLLRSISTHLKKLFTFTHSVILTIDADGKTYSGFLLDPNSISRHHPDYNAITSPKNPIADDIFDVALAAEGPLVFDMDELVRRPGAPRYIAMNHQAGAREMIITPLKDEKGGFGVFVLFCLTKSTFDSNTLRTIKGISHQLSTAVINIMATQKINSQLEEINAYRQQLENENLYLLEQIQTGYNHSEIVGAGAAMQKVFLLLSQVSFANSTVLIMGETGTGKELIARAVHNASPRKDKLMVKVNCAALPPNLIESELFGHERGAFTGATERRIGKFELANNSTLFLDEIGEMPQDLQVKLLRAIQEKEIERVGGKGPIRTDVRIIAATNRDLQQEVKEGRFRTDLFYRLNVFPIILPPLRERKEDIPVLASHFIDRFARNTGKKINNISNKVMQDLMAYNWPGNVRELEHLVERSVLLANGPTIKEMLLPRGERSDRAAPGESNYIKTIAENERDHILDVLKKCKGKVFGAGGAAERLGIPVSTLNSRIKKLAIKKSHIFSTPKPPPGPAK